MLEDYQNNLDYLKKQMNNPFVPLPLFEIQDINREVKKVNKQIDRYSIKISFKKIHNYSKEC